MSVEIFFVSFQMEKSMQKIIKFKKYLAYFRYFLFKKNNKRQEKKNGTKFPQPLLFLLFLSYLFFSIIFFYVLNLNFYPVFLFCKLKSKFPLHCFCNRQKIIVKNRKATLRLKSTVCV